MGNIYASPSSPPTTESTSDVERSTSIEVEEPKEVVDVAPPSTVNDEGKAESIVETPTVKAVVPVVSRHFKQGDESDPPLLNHVISRYWGIQSPILQIGAVCALVGFSWSGSEEVKRGYYAMRYSFSKNPAWVDKLGATEGPMLQEGLRRIKIKGFLWALVPITLFGNAFRHVWAVDKQMRESEKSKSQDNN